MSVLSLLRDDEDEVRMSCKGDLFGGPHAVEPPQGLCALIIPGKHIFSPLRIFF